MKSDSTHTRWEADTFPDIQSRSKSSYFVPYLPYKSSGFHTRVRIWWLLVLHFPSDSFIAYTNSYWKSWQTESNSGVFKVMKWNSLPSERHAGLGTALCLLWGLSRNKRQLLCQPSAERGETRQWDTPQMMCSDTCPSEQARDWKGLG